MSNMEGDLRDFFLMLYDWRKEYEFSSMVYSHVDDLIDSMKNHPSYKGVFCFLHDIVEKFLLDYFVHKPFFLEFFRNSITICGIIHNIEFVITFAGDCYILTEEEARFILYIFVYSGVKIHH